MTFPLRLSTAAFALSAGIASAGAPGAISTPGDTVLLPAASHASCEGEAVSENCPAMDSDSNSAVGDDDQDNDGGSDAGDTGGADGDDSGENDGGSDAGDTGGAEGNDSGENDGGGSGASGG